MLQGSRNAFFSLANTEIWEALASLLSGCKQSRWGICRYCRIPLTWQFWNKKYWFSNQEIKRIIYCFLKMKLMGNIIEINFFIEVVVEMIGCFHGTWLYVIKNAFIPECKNTFITLLKYWFSTLDQKPVVIRIFFRNKLVCELH